MLLMFGTVLYLGSSMSLPAQSRGRGAGAGMGQGPAGGAGSGAAASQRGSSNQEMNQNREMNQSQGASAQKGAPSKASEPWVKNTQLAERLQGLLPPGTDLTAASAGFKNSGQFIAAVHVANNLGIPFDSLKKEIESQGSLGKAIQVLKPTMTKTEVDKEVKTAEQEASQDVKTTRTNTTTATQKQQQPQ